MSAIGNRNGFNNLHVPNQTTTESPTRTNGTTGTQAPTTHTGSVPSTNFGGVTGWQNHHHSTNTAAPAGGASALRTLLNHSIPAEPAGPNLLQRTAAPNSVTETFALRGADRGLEDGQSIEIPLRAGEPLHVIETKFSDPRSVNDMEFYVRPRNGGSWEPVRGRDVKQYLNNPDYQLRTDPDAGGAWMNITKVKFEIVDSGGRTLWSAKKTVDPDVRFDNFHGGRYAEKDNVNKTWDRLPDWPMPEGATLRVTVDANRRDYERNDASLDLHYVQPVYVPKHNEKTTVFSAGSFQKPPAAGYDVDPNRPISAVKVTWTDNRNPDRGRIVVNTPAGQHRTRSENVGSGEDKFFILDGVQSSDGKLKVDGGYNTLVKKVEVYYADE